MARKNFSGINDLANALAEKEKITKKEAKQRVYSFLEVLKNELLRSDKDGVQIIDFLTLEKVQRKEKIGRNPNNPEQEIIIPAHKTLKVKVGASFKEKLNQ
ncbi:MAG: HU family DNA-binding protein [Thermosipho sp. (in: Bacteria)]|nr:HU family DNA-binding protein [Thermosipho sp. (in: thermotogales)]